MKSWKPEVKVQGERDWIRNGQAFATKEEAEACNSELRGRWYAVTDCRVTESDEEPNYRWVDGKGQPIAQ
jgi:hypothetical protein